MEYFKYLRQYVGHKPIILPGSVVIIVSAHNEILLQKRHNGNWGLPGGLMDLGESFEDVAKREVLEETGLVVKNLKLLNVYSGSNYYLKVSNGDELYSATAVYYTNDYTGDMTINYSESQDMRYFAISHLPNELADNYRNFVEDYVNISESCMDY
ncbi:MAG TPA: NUDIX hydrolase [Virgibacillus sp.]|nr:NUDIX hydrolase [Virgibacillus sp.]